MGHTLRSVRVARAHRRSDDARADVTGGGKAFQSREGGRAIEGGRRGVSGSGHEQTSTRQKVSMTLVFRLQLCWSSSPKPMAAFPEPNRI